MDDIIGNQLIINRLKQIIKNENIPNFIFSGISGIGKTSTAICMLRDILGDSYLDSVLELNASDDLRKIDVVKNQVNTFLEKKKEKKIVIFDEADSMTKQVQHTLRSIVDTKNNTSRFILICNNLTNIHVFHDFLTFFPTFLHIFFFDFLIFRFSCPGVCPNLLF